MKLHFLVNYIITKNRSQRRDTNREKCMVFKKVVTSEAEFMNVQVSMYNVYI